MGEGSRLLCPLMSLSSCPAARMEAELFARAQGALLWDRVGGGPFADIPTLPFWRLKPTTKPRLVNSIPVGPAALLELSPTHCPGTGPRGEQVIPPFQARAQLPTPEAPPTSQQPGEVLRKHLLADPPHPTPQWLQGFSQAVQDPASVSGVSLCAMDRPSLTGGLLAKGLLVLGLPTPSQQSGV